MADRPNTLVPPAGLPSIAVLPFRSVGAERVGRYFGDGIVEDIIVSLANLRDLFVISRGSTLSLRNRQADLQKVGGLLGVRYVVTGTVSRQGQRLRLWMTLNDASSGEVIHGDRWEIPLGDLFDAQDRIVEETVLRIAPKIQRAELVRALRKRPEDMNAYDCVLQAIDLFYQLKRKGFERAEELLQRAREIDPAFSSAYTWAAWIHMYRLGLGWSSDRARDIGEATRLSTRAWSLDEHNARALATRGHLKSFVHHDFENGLRDLESALQACPNDPLCFALMSASLSYVGRGTESIMHAERALRLSPIDRYRFYYLATLGLAHYVVGQCDDAIKWLRISVSENAAFTPSLRYLAAALAAAGRVDEAQETGRALLRLQPDFTLRQYQSGDLPFSSEEQGRAHIAHLRAASLPA